MRNVTVILIISFIFLNCQHKEKPVSKETEEITKVVQAILDSDSMATLKNATICSELVKIPVEMPVQRKDSLMPPVLTKNLLIDDFLKEKINGALFFTSKDSSFIMSQNAHPTRLQLENSILDEFNSTITFQEVMIKLEKQENYNYFEMSIPIFSLDRHKAYVQLDHYCGSLCGSGEAIYLKKVKGVWKIVSKSRTWVS